MKTKKFNSIFCIISMCFFANGEYINKKDNSSCNSCNYLGAYLSSISFIGASYRHERKNNSFEFMLSPTIIRSQYESVDSASLTRFNWSQKRLNGYNKETGINLGIEYSRSFYNFKHFLCKLYLNNTFSSVHVNNKYEIPRFINDSLQSIYHSSFEYYSNTLKFGLGLGGEVIIKRIHIKIVGGIATEYDFSFKDSQLFPMIELGLYYKYKDLNK